MFEFKNVSKTFKKDFWSQPFDALRDVTFKIDEGELIGFLGANGAGKTTALKILMKFIKSSGGEVYFSESLGNDTKSIFSNIGYLPERPYFYPYLTGREFTTYMGRLNEVPRNILNDQIDRWATRFQIDHAMDRKIRGYSKGMLQRLGFVSVLVHNPKLLILDEPLSGLDPRGRKEIKDVLKELKALGKSIFFSSHIVSDVEEVCNSVVVLEHGKLLYDGSIEKIISENIRPGFRIKVENDEGNLDIIEIEAYKKNEMIQKLLGNNREIISIEQNRPTLEEIVYQIKAE
jgi:ABC-2 type transport system ATP-binding protein